MGRMAWAGGQRAEPRGQRKDQESGPALALVSSWVCLLPAHTAHFWCLFPLLSCYVDAHLAEKHLLGMKVNLEPQYIKQLVRALLRGAASERPACSATCPPCSEALSASRMGCPAHSSRHVAAITGAPQPGS